MPLMQKNIFTSDLFCVGKLLSRETFKYKIKTIIWLAGCLLQLAGKLVIINVCYLLDIRTPSLIVHKLHTQLDCGPGVHHQSHSTQSDFEGDN